MPAVAASSRPPEASFAHPLFLGALGLLALNDHVLKGGRMLPAVVTGKLSDVAGLLIAPLVLAWLLRARGRRGWLACHVAVGVGFALVQLAPVAAGLEDALRWLGIGARLWADPTDLLALPALLPSYRWLRVAPDAPRARHTVVGVLALVLCTATPAPGGDPPPRYPFPPAGVLSTDVFVRHMGSEDLTLTVRALRDQREVDCDALLEAPEGMLEDGDFGDEQRWTLARGDAVPLWDRRGGAVDRDCYAVRLAARGREWFLTWRHGAPAVRDIDIRLDTDEAVEADAVVVANDGDDPPRAPGAVTVRPRP